MHYDSITATSDSGGVLITGFRRAGGGFETVWETVDDGSLYAVRRAPTLEGPWTTLAESLPHDSPRHTNAKVLEQAFFQVVRSLPGPLLDSGGFEEGADLTGWEEVVLVTPSPSVWQVGEPTASPPDAYRGSRVAGTILDGNYPPLWTDVAFRTPEIDLTGVTQATLTFFHWFALVEETMDRGIIRVVDSHGSLLAEGFTADYTGQSGGWLPAQIPLPEAAIGNVVRIDFYLRTLGDAGTDKGWYLDDVIVR